MRTIKNVTEEKGKKMLKSLIAFLNANNGEGDVTPLQESCLENPMDEGAWWAAVYGVAQSRTRLKWQPTPVFLPGESQGRGSCRLWGRRLPSMGPRRVGHDCSSSRFVIDILPRSKCLLILWLQSPSAVILKPKKMKYDTVSTFSLSVYHEVMGPDAMTLVF